MEFYQILSKLYYMGYKKNYIIVKDRHPYLSEVLNDCVNLCVTTTKNESLASILQKICNKINNNFTQLNERIVELENTVVELQTQIDELS